MYFRFFLIALGTIEITNSFPHSLKTHYDNLMRYAEPLERFMGVYEKKTLDSIREDFRKCKNKEMKPCYHHVIHKYHLENLTVYNLLHRLSKASEMLELPEVRSNKTK